MITDHEPPVFIQLGRYGDLILLFPAFKAIYDRTGQRPIVIVSSDYAHLFDGITYAKPMVVHWHWWQGIPAARRLAEAEFGGAIVPQWWQDTRENLIDQQKRGATVLQCHGHEWGVNLAEWPNFQTSMWDRAGFTVEEMRTLPVVFDRRDTLREKSLLTHVRGANRPDMRPLLLYNFSGHSSPFAPVPEYMRVILRYNHVFKLVDLGRIKAQRIYDLLGLYDAAAGLITIDTATLHLAGAGNVEYIAFTRSDWSSSVPKGKCVQEIKYHGAEHYAESIVPILERWAGQPSKVLEPLTYRTFGSGGGGGMLAV